MVQAQTGRTRLRAFRLAALLLAIALIFVGTANFFRSSLASTVEDDDPDYPRLFEDVEHNLKIHYLDQDRVGPRARKLTERALSMLENMVDEIYVENSDPENPHVVVHVGNMSKVISLSRITNLDQAIDVLKDLDGFFKAYYHGKHSINDIRYYEMNGFLSGLDPHTQVFNPKGFRDFSVHIEGEIFGVGMYVGSVKGTLTVKNVLPGTPAERAGFKRGDRIVKIGEESTVNMDVNEAVKKIRGPEHSRVVLTVKRKESKKEETFLTLPIEVQRERVTIPSVVAKLLPLARKGQAAEEGKAARTAVGYVQVTNFDKNTVPSLKEGLESLRAENGGRDPDCLILDLRENSGGLLQQASDMADLFLPSGELYWIAQKNREEVKEARNDRREPRYPMVVLGNDLSASGAEIVIGALQKNNRAVVLGTPTFGKGSVQQLHPLLNDWQLKITVSEYLIPGKVSIQENGVVPDILAERVVISDKINNLFPNRRLGTERDYDEHLISRFKKDEQPSERIQYISSEPVDPEVEDPDAPEPVVPGEIDPAKDTLAQIALDLLRIAVKDGGGASDEAFRSDVFLRRHAADIDGVRRDRFAEIVKRLQDRGIDWEEGANPESPGVELTVQHRQIEKPSTDKDDQVPKPFLVLTARATNRSDRPLYRIKAITRSDYPYYRDLEFLFGRINPAGTVERTVEVPTPYYPFARNDLIQFAVSGSSGKSITDLDHEVILAAQERPAFSYVAKLVSKDKKEPLSQLAPSTEAILQLQILNTGKVAAHKGVAILRNETGPEVFLEPPGRIDFTELEPGKPKEVEFAFRITGNSTRKSYKFELGMIDSYSGESLSRDIEIPAAGSDVPGFPSGKEFHPPEILAAAVDGDAPAGGELPKSILVTDRPEVTLIAKVRNGQAPFNAWVTDSPLGLHESDPDKVFFAASKGTDDLQFRARVPLKNGTNMIHVVASDENGLQNREVLVVRRRPAQEAGNLTERIEEAALAVYAQLGPGFGKAIYQAALPLELRKRGLRFEVKPHLPVRYDQVEVGQHELDLIVENEILVQLNAKDAVGETDTASLRSFLKLAGKQHGLVVNFSGSKVETQRVLAPEVARSSER